MRKHNRFLVVCGKGQIVVTLPNEQNVPCELRFGSDSAILQVCLDNRQAIENGRTIDIDTTKDPNDRS